MRRAHRVRSVRAPPRFLADVLPLALLPVRRGSLRGACRTDRRANRLLSAGVGPRTGAYGRLLSRAPLPRLDPLRPRLPSRRRHTARPRLWRRGVRLPLRPPRRRLPRTWIPRLLVSRLLGLSRLLGPVPLVVGIRVRTLGRALRIMALRIMALGGVRSRVLTLRFLPLLSLRWALRVLLLRSRSVLSLSRLLRPGRLVAGPLRFVRAPWWSEETPNCRLSRRFVRRVRGNPHLVCRLARRGVRIVRRVFGIMVGGRPSRPRTISSARQSPSSRSRGQTSHLDTMRATPTRAWSTLVKTEVITCEPPG